MHDGLAQDLAGVSLLVSSVMGKLPSDGGSLYIELHQVREILLQSIDRCRLLADSTPARRNRLIELNIIWSRRHNGHTPWQSCCTEHVNIFCPKASVVSN